MFYLQLRCHVYWCVSYHILLLYLLYFQFDLHSDQGVAIITIPVTEDFSAMLKQSNISIENKEPTLTTANLVWDLKDVCNIIIIIIIHTGVCVCDGFHTSWKS